MHPMYKITKTYHPENGFSATFRQHRAKSHCRFIHGYALGIRVTICSNDVNLDENGWVYNFGGLKPFKAWLEDTFDHKMLVAKDDPAINLFRDMNREPHLYKPQLIQMVEVERVGCEGFAKLVHDKLASLIEESDGSRIWLESVEVFEHHGNSATYVPERTFTVPAELDVAASMGLKVALKGADEWPPKNPMKATVDQLTNRGATEHD
jgi:6-pyruvoyltetrahydropterin/6-carboxytetrahydropterin synthase